MRIELLTAPGCPHAAVAKETITDCLTELGLDLPIIALVGRYSSPTVLIDGVDVMRAEAAAPIGDACRLDLPTPQRVLEALRNHRPIRSKPRQHQPNPDVSAMPGQADNTLDPHPGAGPTVGDISSATTAKEPIR